MSERGGCIGSMAALLSIMLIACLLASGLAVFLSASAGSGWRWIGITSVAVAGCLTLLHGRSDRFARVLAFLHDPVGFFTSGPDPTIVGTDYRRVAGVHPGPGVLGVMFLLLAAALVAAALVASE